MQATRTTMRSRILPDEHYYAEQQQLPQQQQQKPLLLSKKTNALLASWDQHRQQRHHRGGATGGGGRGGLHPLTPRGSHKDRSSNASSVWTVKLPKRMLYTVLSVFLAIPLFIFFWKETHAVKTDDLHNELRHRDQPGHGMQQLSEMDRLKATWMMEGETGGGGDGGGTAIGGVVVASSSSSSTTKTASTSDTADQKLVRSADGSSNTTTSTTTTTNNKNSNNVLTAIVDVVGKNATKVPVVVDRAAAATAADTTTSTTVDGVAKAVDDAGALPQPGEGTIGNNENVVGDQNDGVTDDLLRVMSANNADEEEEIAAVATAADPSNSGIGGDSADEER
jgi:hypothetical protein